jgi:two-component system, NarL family, nitrate/nitrite response regulator NarL
MRILLADDHDLLRDTLEVFLQRLDPQVQVFHARSFPDALDQASRAASLDLILLDLRMPGMNGLAGLEVMRQRYPAVPVVVMSGEVSRDIVFSALGAGAAGFIPKVMGGKAMLNALQLILSGERYVPDLVLSSGQPWDDDGAGRSGSDNPLSKLSRRERDVMALLTKGHSNKEIAKALQIEAVTVALHLSSIYRKLAVANRTQAVKVAMQHGWEA